MEDAQRHASESDGSCAALRESLTIQGRTFQKDILPLCKGENKWLLSP